MREEKTPPVSVPDLFLERYLLNELSPDQRDQLEARLARDITLKARLDALRSATEEFARTHDAGRGVHGVNERLRRAAVETALRRGTEVAGIRGRMPAFGRMAGGGALLALVALPAWRVLDGSSHTLATHSAPQAPAPTPEASSPVPPAGPQREAPEAQTPGSSPVRSSPSESSRSSANPGIATPGAATSSSPADESSSRPEDRIAASTRTDASVSSGESRPETRLKGTGPALALFRKTATGSEPLPPGSRARAGDVIRIGYRAGGQTFGAIFSVDGNGSVTRHWPATGEKASTLEPGEHLLPGAFELDAAPDYERFFLVTGERAFDLKPLLEALHAGKTPSTPSGLNLVRFDLLKDSGT
jgi:hypothetical protein